MGFLVLGQEKRQDKVLGKEATELEQRSDCPQFRPWPMDRW